MSLWLIVADVTTVANRGWRSHRCGRMTENLRLRAVEVMAAF
jgi:hypothetical protein